MKNIVNYKESTSVTINGNKLEYRAAEIDIKHLNFWKGNPRIYTKVQLLEENGTRDITKDDIYDELRKMKEFDKLLKEVKENNYEIYESVWVGKDKETNEYIVYEGNTRLAVAMLLYKNHHKKLSKLNVNLYSDDTSIAAIRNHVIDFHVKGKAKWKSFEAHGMFYREVEYKREIIKSENRAIEEVANENNMSEADIRMSHKIITFLKKHRIPLKIQSTKLTYFEELLRPKYDKMRKKFNDPSEHNDYPLLKDAFDEKIIEVILAGGTSMAAGNEEGAFRDNLKNIGRAYDPKVNKRNKHIYDFLTTDISMQTAGDVGIAGGAGDKDYLKIKEFSDYINNRNVKNQIMSAKKNYKDLDIFLMQIIKAVKEIRIDFKKLKARESKLKKK